MIYWDNNATTSLSSDVYEAMKPFFEEMYFNPSAGYGCAKKVRQAVEDARESVAALLGVASSEVVFTSGGTEATNMAFRQIAGIESGGIGVLSTDHDASIKTSKALGNGRICPVDREGRVVLEEWEAMCSSGVSGVSFAWANNETGVLQDADVLCSIARDNGVSVHLDVVQCVGKIPVNLHEMSIDYASVSAHKFHGPKGIGCLYRRAGVELSPLLFGGGQENGWRSGTENVPAIVGFGVAAQIALKHVEEEAKRLAYLRDRFEALVLARLSGVKVHSAEAKRIPNTSNLGFDGCTAEGLLLLLEPAGLLCSAGSACHTLQPMPSSVLTAMGLSDQEARASLRFSLSSITTQDDVDLAATLVTATVNKIRDVQSSRTGPVLVYHP